MIPGISVEISSFQSSFTCNVIWTSTFLWNKEKTGLYFPFLGDRAEVQKWSKLSRAPVYHGQWGWNMNSGTFCVQVLPPWTGSFLADWLFCGAGSVAFLSEQRLVPFCHLDKNSILLFFLAKNNDSFDSVFRNCFSPHLGLLFKSAGMNSPLWVTFPFSSFPIPGWLAGLVGLRTANKPGVCPLSAS